MAGPLDGLLGYFAPQASLLDGAPMYHGGPQAGPAQAGFVPGPQNFRDVAQRTLDPQTPDERMGANVVRGFAESPAAIRAYHGSPTAGLTELRPSERGPLGPATYLSPSPRVAEQYGRGGTVYQADLPDEIFHGAGRSWMPEGANPFQVARDQTAKVVAAAPEHYRPAVQEIADATTQSGDGGYQFFGRLSQLFRSQEAAQQLMQRAGYKGVSGLVDGPEIGMFGSVPLRAPE